MLGYIILLSVSNTPICGSSFLLASCRAAVGWVLMITDWRQQPSDKSAAEPDSPGPAFPSKPHAPYLRQTFENLGSLAGHSSYPYPALVPVGLVPICVQFFTLDQATHSVGLQTRPGVTGTSRPCSKPGISEWWPLLARVSPGSCHPGTCENSQRRPT